MLNSKNKGNSTNNPTSSFLQLFHEKPLMIESGISDGKSTKHLSKCTEHN